MPRRKSDRPGAEEILGMEISEDKRLRESGIDPDGDPIEIMMEVRRRCEAWDALERLEEEAAERARADLPAKPAE